MRGWTGPRKGDIDCGGTVKDPPLPPWLWPYGPPSAHDSWCRLHGEGLFCDCSASDASEDTEEGGTS